MRYYLDTSIWMDVYEDRKGFKSEPLGDYALKLLGMLKANKIILVVTDILIKELELNYSIPEINGMMNLFNDITEKVMTTTKQFDEAKRIAKERNVPMGDVLHSIIARDNNLILITRDKHFKQLEDIAKHYRPEDII
jgi:predicted nucleic acid-binding protein